MKHMDIVFKSHIILLELSLGQFLPIPYPHSLEVTIFNCFFWYLFPCCQIIGWDWCLLICFSILGSNYWLLDIRVEDPSMCALSLSTSSIHPMWLDYLFCLNKYSIFTWIWLCMAQSWAVWYTMLTGNFSFSPGFINCLDFIFKFLYSCH